MQLHRLRLEEFSARPEAIVRRWRASSVRPGDRFLAAAFVLLVAAAGAARASEPITCRDARPESPAPGTARWAVAEGGGEASFVLHTFWHDVDGKTSSLTATLDSASGDVSADGSVSVCVDAAALQTGNDKRDRKMREDHLEVAKFPRLEFRSTTRPGRESSETGSAGGALTFRAEVTGDLTLHGVTKRVSVPIEAVSEAGGWLMKGALIVRLSEYAIPDPSIALNKVKDEVDVRFEIRFRKTGG